MRKVFILLLFFVVVGTIFEADAQRRKLNKTTIKIEDKFETIDTTLRWVSSLRIHDDVEKRFLYGCHDNKFQIKVPIALTGLEKNMEFVIQTLTEKMIGHATPTFEDAIKYVEANFSKEIDDISFKRENQEIEDDMISAMNSGWTSIRLWPYFSTSKLVGFVVYSQEGGYGEDQSITNINFVTFVRNASGTEILCDNIYNTSVADNKILRLINQEISEMNQKEGGDVYEKATFVSDNIRIEKTGISYIYKANDVASGARELIAVTISYVRLRPYLRPAFYKLITSSTDWVKYENPF